MEKHECEFNLPMDIYGPAIDNCSENDDGELWVDNGEYASRVNFCPYCGYEAKVKVNLTPTQEA